MSEGQNVELIKCLLDTNMSTFDTLYTNKVLAKLYIYFLFLFN